MHHAIQLFNELLVVISQTNFTVVGYDKCYDVFFIPDFVILSCYNENNFH